MEKRPLPADEKTKVIPQGLINQPKPVPPGAAAAAAPRPLPKTPFGTPIGEGEKEAIQKKRIVPGLLIGGGLLAGGLLLTSFATADAEADPALDAPLDAAAAAGQAAGAAVPAVVTTSLPVSDVVADDLPLEEARELARAEVGAEGLFKHQGVIHTTRTEEEMEQLSPEEREAFMEAVAVQPNTTSGSEIDVNGQLMEIKFPLMKEHTEILVDEDGRAYSRDLHGDVNLLDNVTEDPLSGELVRTDPETGEVTQFNPTAILQNVDEGRIDISVYPSDVEITDSGEVLWQEQPVDPLINTTYLTNYNEDGSWVAGYDVDGDGIVDVAFDESGNYEFSADSGVDFAVLTEEGVTEPAAAEVAEPGSDAELLNDRIHQIAEDSGIDDIRKIKVNETEDGYNVKIKGEDGEKIKMHLSKEDLHSDQPDDLASGVVDDTNPDVQAASGDDPSSGYDANDYGSSYDDSFQHHI